MGTRSQYRRGGLGHPQARNSHCWNGKRRVEYACRGYPRNGKSYCTSYHIHEEVLDAVAQGYAETITASKK